MKRLMSLIMFLVLVGSVVANISPQAPRSILPVEAPRQLIRGMDWFGPSFMIWRSFLPWSFFPVEPNRNSNRDLIPVPPVCGMACPRMPVQSLGE